MYCQHVTGIIRVYPSKQAWVEGQPFGYTHWSETQASKDATLYTIPTPPAAKCDGSGTIKWDTGGPAARCPGCTACKPEPKDGAEEVARKIVADWMSGAGSDGREALERHLTAAIRADRDKQAARQGPPPGEDQTADIVDRALKTLAMGPGAAAIQAHGLEEATKQHLRFSFWSCCLDALIRGGNNAKDLAARPATELRGKIRQLCEEAIKQGERRTIESFARDVLAQLEGK